MINRILGGLAAAAMLAAGLAMTTGVAQADEVHPERSKGCEDLYLPTDTEGVSPLGFWQTLSFSTEDEDCIRELSLLPDPTLPKLTAPTCFAPGTVELPETTENYDWVDDGTYFAVADYGFFFGVDAVTEFDPGNLAQLIGSQCDIATSTTEPPVITVPPTTPPVTGPPAITAPSTTSATVAPAVAVVAALPPAQAPTTTAPTATAPTTTAPTTTAPTTVATVPAAGLPATGSNGTGTTALIALLATSLGGAALLGARRRTSTS